MFGSDVHGMNNHEKTQVWCASLRTGGVSLMEGRREEVTGKTEKISQILARNGGNDENAKKI